MYQWSPHPQKPPEALQYHHYTQCLYTVSSKAESDAESVFLNAGTGIFLVVPRLAALRSSDGYSERLALAAGLHRLMFVEGLKRL